MENIEKILLKYGEKKTLKKLDITKRYLQGLLRGEYENGPGKFLRKEIDRVAKGIRDERH